jgi:hypothetical protein
MKPCEAITVNNRLVNDVSMACLAAIKAGMSKEDVVAVLTRIQELIENSEDA